MHLRALPSTPDAHRANPTGSRSQLGQGERWGRSPNVLPLGEERPPESSRHNGASLARPAAGEKIRPRPFLAWSVAPQLVTPLGREREGEIQQKGQRMPYAPPVYSTLLRDVHHNNSLCTERNNIESRYLGHGTGSLPLCSHCARLKRLGL